MLFSSLKPDVQRNCVSAEHSVEGGEMEWPFLPRLILYCSCSAS